MPNSSSTFAVKWRFRVQWIESERNIRTPDPNREITPVLLEQDIHTVLEQSYKRRNEELKLVYALGPANRIHYPPTDGQIAIHGLGNGIDQVVVYEIDAEKVLIPGDDSPVNPVPPSREQSRRWAAYKAYTTEVNRRSSKEEPTE